MMGNPYDVVTPAVTNLPAFIAGTYPPEVRANGELMLRRRTGKLAEEVGEVAEAVAGVVGENFRKGVTHTLDDVLKECLDVTVAALGAYESLTGNRGLSGEALRAHCAALTKRAGLD